MAVSKMQAVNIIGLVKDIDEVVSVLGESGIFHPDDVTSFHKDTRNFTHLFNGNIYAEPLADLKAAIALTEFDVPYTDVAAFNPTMEEIELFVGEFNEKAKKLVETKNLTLRKFERAEKNLEEAKHFVGLAVDIEQVLSLKYLNSRFGKLPKESYSKLSAYKDNPFVDFTICTEDNSYYWGVYLAPVERSDEIDEIFSKLYFERSDIMEEGENPEDYLKNLKESLPVLKENSEKAEAELNLYMKENLDKLSLYLTKLEKLSLFERIRSKILRYNNSFVIVGWVESSFAKSLSKQLKKINSVDVYFSDAKIELSKSPPVKLKNSFLAKPFEFYTEMYGVPKYNEIDPTLFIAITYTVIFGIMFADVGQGIILSIVGYLMWKLKKMKIGPILIPCGISSAVFGLVFGSVFGFEHLLDPLYKSLFNLDEKPIEVMSSDSIILILLSAVAIGIFLVITAMCLNVYSSFKQGDIGKALFGSSGIAGIIFYSAIVFGVAGQLLLGLSIFNLPYILGLIVFPYLLIFFSEPLGGLIKREPDWQPESWGGYIMEHLIESIEFLLEYVTNTVSFLRVGAFVLVHAGMMMVVFVLAETAGAVAYWPVVVFGNIFVMVLEALLVSIQVLRLEYYEMFSRFYSGEGRAFEPVNFETK